MANFIEKLTRAIERNDSLLCVGLDPDLSRVLSDVLPGAPDATRAQAFCLSIIERTHDLVCAYKPNIAFFEQLGPEGLDALRAVIEAVPDGIPVLLDAKRGDIGNTARAYARAAFDVWGADAVTVSPYLGADSVAPFLEHGEGTFAFLLCYTSNPSAAAVQQHGAPPLYHHIAVQGQAWGDAAQVGFVVGATQPAALAAVRELAPDRWILAPGVGAQGGDLTAALDAGLDAQGGGVIVPVSRGVLYAEDPRAAAQELRARINQARACHAQSAAEPETSEKSVTGHTELILDLFESGCVQFGEFTLASGGRSPIYIDLRRVISFPGLFRDVVRAYGTLVEALTFDRLAAVPYAALPVCAALAARLERPMIYPRKAAKSHGTRRDVEGAFEAGQTALTIEDVITSGGSLLEAIDTLESAGLRVRDVIVLVDRQQGGREALAERGYRVHAVLTLSEMLDTLLNEGAIPQAVYDEVRAYLRGSE